MTHPAPTITPAPPPKKPRASGWTPERRARQAAAIRQWKPWARSTGPRTAEGKATSRLNAHKHGLRSAAGRELDAAMREYSALLTDLEKTCRLYKRLGRAGRKFTWPTCWKTVRNGRMQKNRANELMKGGAVPSGKLCKNLDFSALLRQKVNANDGCTLEHTGLCQAPFGNPRGGRHVGRGGFIRRRRAPP